jgi:Spy/CpxP family protein refolding chaperone
MKTRDHALLVLAAFILAVAFAIVPDTVTASETDAAPADPHEIDILALNPENE